jgi:DNA-binding CsgD family transcriptional regulator
MKRRELHLIDANGDPVSSAIRSAVQATFDYSVAEHPEIDRAVLANMAEQLAVSMEENKESIASVRRYAYAAMRGKVRDWLRTKEATELAVGLGPELDKCARASYSFQGEVDRKILFEQMRSRLSERDRQILLLLQSHAGPADIATELEINYQAAAKAKERVLQRLAECVHAARKEKPRRYARVKDLTKEWI